MVIGSFSEAAHAVPTLVFPVLVIGLDRDGWPFTCVRVQKIGEFSYAAETILKMIGTALVVTSVTGDAPTVSGGR